MKFIVIDRDGVLNHKDEAPIITPEAWIPIPGSLEAIARLNHAGYRVLVITHQPAIARGTLNVDMINTIHQRMHKMVQEVGGLIDAVFFCPDAEPRPGANAALLSDIGNRLQRELQGVPIVGDNLRVIHAARTIGAWPFLVRTGAGTTTIEHAPEVCAGLLIFDDLMAVAEYLTRPSE